MPSTQQTQTKPASDRYKDFEWVGGIDDRWNRACVVKRRDGKGATIYLQGYDKKNERNATVRGSFDFEAIEALRDQCNAILGGDEEE